VFGAAAAFVGQELAVWVDLALEALKGNFSRAGRVRAFRSSVRLYEISAAIRKSS
jgi:hypothetical protein